MASPAVSPCPSPEYLIDVILPARETSLMAGPSGAGKTRFWLPMMIHEWSKGLSVLGFKSHPVPWVYVASDRSEKSVHATLSDMGIHPSTFPMIPAWDRAMTISQILDAVKQHQAKFAVIEAFGSFVESRHHCAIKQFLQAYHKMARGMDLTTLGIMESPKQKPHERYDNPRQRVSGFAAWAHFTETIVLVEFIAPADVSNSQRLLTICPRNAPAFERAGTFDHQGILRFPDADLRGKKHPVNIYQ
jgi:RecA-family ATPase